MMKYFLSLILVIQTLVPSYGHAVFGTPLEVTRTEGVVTEKNYITNSYLEKNAKGYTAYADAAGTRIVDATGGSPNVTCTQTTTNPGEGAGSLLITKDAANRQGQGCSIDFTVDELDQSKVMGVEFEYTVPSGTFVAGTQTTDGDVVAQVYDVTNATTSGVEPSSIKLLSNHATLYWPFNSTFQTASNSKSYRLAWHIASTSTSAFTLKLEKIRVYRTRYVYGTPITDWTPYTPVFANMTGTATGLARKVGDTEEITARMASTSTVAGTVTVSIPSGHIIDTSKLVNNTAGLGALGTSVFFDVSASTSYPGMVRYNSTNTVLPYPSNSAGTFTTDVATNATQPFTWASGDILEVNFSVPIQGWGSSVQMSDSGSQSVVGTSYYGTTTSAANNTETVLLLGTKRTEVGGITYNTSTGKATVSSAGWYFVSGSIGWSDAAGNVVRRGRLFQNSTAIQESIRDFANTSPSNITKGAELPGVLTYAAAGDTFDLRFLQNTGGSVTPNNDYTTQLSVVKVQGSNSIGAVESVMALYINTAGTSVTTTETNLPFATKVVDTHGAYNSGIFRAPYSGKYQWNATTFSTSTLAASQAWGLSGYKQGSVLYGRHVKAGTGASNTSNSTTVSGTVDLNAGETFEIKTSVDSGSSLTLSTISGVNVFSIYRTGL